MSADYALKTQALSVLDFSKSPAPRPYRHLRVVPSAPSADDELYVGEEK